MANPITWRNIGATVSGSGAVSLMQGADKSVTRGFTALNDVLDDRRKLNDENFKTRQTNLAADFQDRIQQAQTLDEVNALREDPKLAELRSQLTGEFRNQVRGSLDKRETGLIDQISKRDTHFDEQTMRELRPQMRQWQARALQGDDSWISEAAQAGITDDDALKGLYDLFTTGMTEGRAQEQNQRSWISTRLQQAQDARATQLHQRNIRSLDQQWAESERERDLDRLVTQLYSDSVNNDMDITGTELRNEVVRTLISPDYGYTLDQATQAAAELSDARLGRLQLAGEDQAAIDYQVSVMAQEQGMPSNSVYQAGGFAQDPLAESNEMLDKFTDERGRWFGQGDPEERIEYGAELHKALGPGIVVGSGRDRKLRRIPPHVAEAAINGVPRGAWWIPGHWGNTVEGAINKYIKEHEGVLEEIDRYNEFEQARQEVEAAGAAATQPRTGRTRLSLQDLLQ